ncbi:MAG TPA: ArsR family transcriptional regulator [Candidatus Limnocylindrales bacterium]|nr:ArsR family transcriptional regulator [Candidatus Limnocylindrales bacterium]
MPARNGEGIELLADPTRRRIIALIAGRVRRPTDMAAALGISQAAVSRQLRLLLLAGLIRWRWSLLDRRSRDYFIDPVMQAPILAWLAGVDLRHARAPLHPAWSLPVRIHGSRRLGDMAEARDVDRRIELNRDG